MAKSMIILGACVVLGAIAACEASPAADSLYSHWTNFKAEHGKQYASPAEEAQRLELFTKNKLAVDKFNREQSQEAGYTLAVNHLSDWTDEEFKQLLGFKMMTDGQPQSNTSELLMSLLEDNKPVPKSVDWRGTGRVSSVKNQGKCGSCWAFSTVGVLEGQELPVKHIKEPISLSPQNVMDCGSFADNPCNGGDMLQALKDVAEAHGVEAESDYPYQTAGGSCKYNKAKAVIANKGAAGLELGKEKILQLAVAKYGPVSVAIEVSDDGNFRSYKSGVFTDNTCHASISYLNHGVLVVGYGTDPEGGDYWIVKNSWSEDWGDKGYIKMARNKKNMCGIASYSVLALF